ncbi:CBO0543 family protein [Bacillus salitolerans]|uniref:CBO0543 family protein n=1 Tax=Bacillus salitolerans TaxID=1437434 RepID=A0ABW4LIH1_9BACI
MLIIFFSIVWIIVAYRFGDRNWRKYYPTMLFAALGNALYEVICYNYSLWQLEPNGLPGAMIPNLLLILIWMPLSTWVFLSHFPTKQSLFKKGLYILLFSAIFMILEFTLLQGGAITYHHGWSFIWSLLFVILMFIVLHIHFKNPIIALILSVLIAFSLCQIFNVSLNKMK